jgi:DNA replication and repair protein RecF
LNGADDYLLLLRTSWTKDSYTQYTTVGIHKDDLVFRIGEENFPIKKFGSQGQQKTFVLALKLAQFEYIASSRNLKPILLLDDVFDKLDMERVKQLIVLVGSERFGQVFLTDTQKERIEMMFQDMELEHEIFIVEKDKICSLSIENKNEN